MPERNVITPQEMLKFTDSIKIGVTSKKLTLRTFPAPARAALMSRETKKKNPMPEIIVKEGTQVPTIFNGATRCRLDSPEFVQRVWSSANTPAAPKISIVTPMIGRHRNSSCTDQPRCDSVDGARFFSPAIFLI